MTLNADGVLDYHTHTEKAKNGTCLVKNKQEEKKRLFWFLVSIYVQQKYDCPPISTESSL
jgi:hypothetical protein